MDSEKFLNSRVDVIAMHRYAHFDELLAAWTLKTFGGNSFFPGANHARLEFLDSMPNGKTWEDLLVKERKLLVGMGYSPFDEHLVEGGRKPGQCAATLVAEALDLREDEALKPILHFALRRDSAEGDNPYELPKLIKTLWNSDVPDKKDAIQAWAFMAFDGLYQKGINFAEQTCDDYEKAGKAIFLDDAGRRISFVYGRSDSADFGAYARYKKAGIMLWINSKGNAIIQTDHRLKIDLSPVVRAVRIAEICEMHRIKPKEAPFPLNLNHLSSDGKIEECPSWFYHAVGRQLMNGSLGHYAPPTLLSLERLANIVKAVLSHDSTLSRLKEAPKPSKRYHHQWSKGSQPSPRQESSAIAAEASFDANMVEVSR